MGYWSTTVEETSEGKFFLQMTEYDYADHAVSDVDEPYISAGMEFETREEALEFARLSGLRVARW